MRGAARISLALALTLTGVAEAQTVRPIVIGEAPVPGVAAASNAPQRPDGALDCAIQPSRIVEVASPIDGVLAEVFVRAGQPVKKGDLIARVDTDIAAAELANAEARAAAQGALKMAEARAAAAAAEYRTQKKAYEGRVAPRVDFERARGELNVAQGEVRREREALTLAAADRARMALIVSKGEIRAPFDGVIGEDVLDPSEAIEGRPVAQLIVIDPMRVEVFAPVAAAEAVRGGAERVVVSRIDDPVIAPVELDYVSPLADGSSQTIRVYYHLSHDGIAPGFRCFLASPEAAERFRAAVRGDAPTEEATQ